ncbi:hypothetical protein TNCV_2308161 [Trichonephila clavipes]|nr:hypothetical protein TNCV_2308161 [Trichonephila clavipes]
MRMAGTYLRKVSGGRPNKTMANDYRYIGLQAKRVQNQLLGNNRITVGREFLNMKEPCHAGTSSRGTTTEGHVLCLEVRSGTSAFIDRCKRMRYTLPCKGLGTN